MNLIHRFPKALLQFIIHNSAFLILFSSCSLQKKIGKSAKYDVVENAALLNAHIGISIYEPSTGKYWYDYNADKYFVPASNVKIPTCYAAMKYLGDSLVGLKYAFGGYVDSVKTLVLEATGDPTFFHPDFRVNRVLDRLKEIVASDQVRVAIFDTIFKADPWGNGWAWNDYRYGYMAERSVLPVYGNVIVATLIDSALRNDENYRRDSYFKIVETNNRYFNALMNYNSWFLGEERRIASNPKLAFKRNLTSNDFRPYEASSEFKSATYPFFTHGYHVARTILEDTLAIKIGQVFAMKDSLSLMYDCPNCKSRKVELAAWNKIYSQPTDSVLKPMMHRSDNFFAEQSLLMVSNERLGTMNDEKIIDTLLKADFNDLPQQPRWVDGSGLSRYNLFTPKDLVAILGKIKTEFGMSRIKTVFPTGGEGTLANYFKSDSGYIYAKTGTLSGVVALSGYLFTKKGKELIFSVLVNNHQSSATDVRRAVERFLQELRNNY